LLGRHDRTTRRGQPLHEVCVGFISDLLEIRRVYTAQSHYRSRGGIAADGPREGVVAHHECDAIPGHRNRRCFAQDPQILAGDLVIAARLIGDRNRR
jgi:hypothetical protein